MNQWEKQSKCTWLVRWKTHVNKSWLVFVLQLIGWVSDTRFLNQSQSVGSRSFVFQQAEEIRTSAATYVIEITELLNRVPRQLLLLLKTNDLLRSIDYRLNTSDTSRSFITMSRCCVRALTKQRLKTCGGWRDWVRIQADSTMSHLRITLYQVYVSSLVSSLRRLFTSIIGGLTFLWYPVV